MHFFPLPACFKDFSIIKDNFGKIKIENVDYKSVWIYKYYGKSRKIYYILPTDEFEKFNQLFKFSNADKQKFKTFENDTKELINIIK